jgi:GntR family transcriptional regulator
MRKRTDVLDALRQRVISARHFNAVPPGGRLPSARALAEEMRADARVVVAAYRELEREGLVERRPPSRRFFATGHASGGSRAGDRRTVVAATTVGADEWLVDVLAQALERDVAVPGFPEYARRAMETLRLRAACIECNLDQQEWLRRELSDDYGFEAEGVELEAAEAALGEISSGDELGAAHTPLAARLLPPALRRASLLVTTPAHEPVVRELAERSGKGCVIVTHRADLAAELERLLADGPVYFVGTDVRFAAKIRALFSAWAHVEHVRPVILGGNDPGEIPPGASVYVMRAARDRLGALPPQVRVLPTLRAFSRETRVQLLRYLVRANLRAAAASAEAEPGTAVAGPSGSVEEKYRSPAPCNAAALQRAV